MADGFEALFAAIREACKPATWSRGVELVRAGAVVAVSEDDEEAVFRVSSKGGMIAPKITLFADDADWDCPCSSRDPGCEHAAAAVIAWRRARDGDTKLQSAEDAGQVQYRFERGDSGLTLERFIVREDRTQALESTLAAVASGRVAGLPFIASQEDLAIELALGTHRRGVLARHLILPVFKQLSRASAITLDGKPVEVSARPVSPRVRLTDQGDGFRLVLEDDPAIEETFKNGIVRCGDTLQPIDELRLSGRELHELPGGVYYPASRVGELMTEILPSLKKRIPLVVETDRLPQTVDEPPRPRIELERDGDRLKVLATIVYGDPPTARVDGGRLVHLGGAIPVRDEPAERRWLRRLQTELELAPGVREELVGEEAVAFCQTLRGWKDAVHGNAAAHFRRAPALVPQVRIDGLQFDVTFESPQVDPGGGRSRPGTADAGAVIRAWRSGASMVPLLGGGWAPLPAEWLERHGHRVADLLEARGDGAALPPSAVLDLAGLCEALDQPLPAELDSLRQLLGNFEGLESVELPSDLTATLRTYQRQGVDWLHFLRNAGLGALLADDMGLGKTLQALCALAGRTLVVAPTSVLHNWADEIRRFRPALTYSVYHGPKRKLDRDVDVTLTTYAILRLDADRLAVESWDTVILDEAQAIKNPESQVAAAAYRLQADFRVTLTGTPVENRLDELWSQFHFINRGLLGGRSDFDERYATPIAAGEEEAARRLRERVRPFVLRRLKREVAPELPPRTDVVLRCELTEEEREVYDTVRAATLSEVVARLQAGGSVIAALEAVLRLRQAACHPALVPGHSASGSSKVALLLEALDNVVAEGHKALVFSQWTSLLDLVEPHLAEAGIGFTRLDGTTRDRGAVVREFQDSGGPPILLISLRAGGTGLNLTAADHVFLLDPWWNPAVEDQAADRAHRIGQERPVMVYRLVAEETVEERILTLQESKRALADAALGQADRAAGLTREDLLALFD